MLLIIFILFPKIGCRYNTGHQFCFFKERGFHETIYLHFIFNNNKEIIPYMFSVTTYSRLYEYTFIKMLQIVANLLTDIVPTFGIPRINHIA